MTEAQAADLLRMVDGLGHMLACLLGLLMVWFFTSLLKK